MKKTLLLFYALTFSLFTTLATAATQSESEETSYRVAVLDPATSGPQIDEGTKIAVRELISSAFVNAGSYTILERSMLDKVMAEAKLTNSDAIDESQATELGKLAGANKVVLSVISKAGNKNMISVKMIDVETASVERQKAKVVNSDELLDYVEPVVFQMLGQEASVNSTQINERKRSSTTTSQEPAVPTDNSPGIYFNGNRMTYARITGQKLGNFVGAYFSLGLSGVKRDMRIEGKTSTLKITDKQPKFTIRFGYGSTTEPYFNDEKYIKHIVLVKLKSGGKERKMQTGSYGLSGVESSLSNKYVIAISVEPIGDGTYTIIPREDLKEGEYCFYFNIPKKKKDKKDNDSEDEAKEEKDSENEFKGVYDFTIVKAPKKDKNK